METIIGTMTEQGLAPGRLTVGDCIALARQTGERVSEVIIAEAMAVGQLTRQEVLSAVMASFSHNLYAIEIGTTTGSSFLMGNAGRELAQEPATPIVADAFLNKVLAYTLGAQVGNHSVGLQPCAGTGDSCTYSGFVKAMLEEGLEFELTARVAAVMMKIGTIFRVGKTTTGCNMEGFGAGSAASAAAFVELAGGSPDQMERAIVMALSPTIANPCTPRVMVAGLCATHIGGGVMIGKLAAQLAMHTSIPITVPADVMIAMAAAVHPISAKYVVPTVIQYMEPFFKTNQAVESYISPDIKADESARIDQTIGQALAEARALASKANPIVKPFSEAVVGGSSQAVGSPTNAARIAHFLAKGDVRKVRIELYAELFARRGINVPGILMAAVYGAGTDNSKLYREVMDKVAAAGIAVEIVPAAEAQLQKITVEATERNGMVETLNRGGARLVLKNASDLPEAFRIAKELGIDTVE
ncbi:L-serine ammonia-lyase, iron-sulfur-dependent, subunit alpha [Anaeroselena agilis]|uniref:L-serine ammonia-lyase, iron-sulfur-dependent, subunit alpha n=1 Tax=Anaeroselena agilis TaxID=3063788 RepID=A0ABU3P2Q5_9FIRM|nr:L-serine ammonia-lyase, iron-sulfur-dependent, subunit alpha [Selenomonadales bacterium 4137-cl]